ncbi:MAG TPA: hypothetical protein VHF27_08120 [Acidimicrobiales bacterium]|nr:hypothetical protein [Acidimicrobiales bacterium]
MSPTAHEKAVTELLHRLADYAETRPRTVPDAPLVELSPRPRRRWPAAAAAAALLLVAALAGASLALRDDRRGRVTPGRAGGATDRLADPGIAGRSGAASVWTGEELLVWGGSTLAGSENEWLGDGAALDPVANRWRPLPPAPIGPRSDPAAVWTGSEMVVWGGTAGGGGILADGAAFDPKTNRWRPIAPQPFGGSTRPAVVWTGTEMLVVSSVNGLSTSAYDPRADRWRLLAPPPGALVMPFPQVVWTGSQAVLVLWPSGASGIGQGSSSGPMTVPHPAGPGSTMVPSAPPATPPPPPVGSPDGRRGPNANLFLAGYSPDSDQWTRLPDVELADGGVPRLVWTGREVLVVQMRGRPGAAFDPERQAWRPLEAPPPEEAFADKAVWTGRFALLWAGGERGLAYDPEQDVWSTFDAGGLRARSDAEVVWADGLLLGWGGYDQGAPRPRLLDDGIRYRPPAG